MKNTLSPQVVKTISTNLHENYKHSNNHWWIKLLNKPLWIILWIIITILGLTGIIISIIFLKNKFFTIISIIIFIISVFLLTQTVVLKNKVYTNLIEALPLQHYYHEALIDNNANLNLENITDSWTIKPQGNLPLDEAPNYYNYCENIMIGTINNQPFNYGSIINQKVIYEVKETYNSIAQIIEKEKTVCYYTRFVYYTTIIKNNSFTMTLTPRNIVSKKLRRKEKVQLESLLFEDLFSIKCDDQIKLRLILEPKVMVQLNTLAVNLQKNNLPIIHIHNEQLTLSWEYKLGKNSYNDGKGKLMVMPATNSYDKLIAKLLIMISDDILKLKQAQSWITHLSLLS